MSWTPDCKPFIRIVRLDVDRLDELMSIQEQVCAQLEMPELYFPVTEGEMQEFFRTDGICYGAMHESRLVGFFGVLLMRDRPDNVGHDLGLMREELARVVYFKAVNVLPEYRGLGLQKSLTQAVFKELGVDLPLRSTSGLDAASRVMCATVSPLNLSSLKSFLECGFWIAGLKPMYEGYQRFLVMRRGKKGSLDLAGTVTVPVQDYPDQERLLAQGMCGIRLHASLPDAPSIIYSGSEKIAYSGKDGLHECIKQR